MIIVEDGTIVAGANAYIDSTYLDSYWADRNVTIPQTQAEKDAAIIIATQYIELNNKWRGSIVNDDQELGWPRQYAYDNEGRLFNSVSIPDNLKKASAEYAKRQLDSDLQPDVSELGAIKMQRDKLDVLETEVEYQDKTGGYYGIKRYPLADNYLKPLTTSLVGGGNMSKMVRC